MGLISKLIGKEAEEEVDYDISDSGMDPKFLALYSATEEFYRRLFGETDKDPYILLEKLLVESGNAYELLFGSNDKTDVAITDVAVAASALVSYNGDPSDDDFRSVYRVISTSISEATDGKTIKEYSPINVLIASAGLRGMIKSI